jgi:hypothetical protein
MNTQDKLNNVFQIYEPEKWWCSVSGLSSAHTVLRIDVIRRTEDSHSYFDEVIFLEFRKVAYYSGWMTWVGANFRLASEEEKLHFVRSLRQDKQLPNEVDILSVCS